MTHAYRWRVSLRSICVFCASSPGTDPALLDVAREVGAGLARRGIRVVYGGGGSGLMGALADGALGEGGEVVGIIPGFMVDREWGRQDLTELHVVDSMHERKALMAEHADAFLVLPGGIGTLEEFFEVWTWRQIGLHATPIALLDAPTETGEGFWQPLLEALRGIYQAGFVSEASLEDVIVAAGLEAALEGLEERAAAGQTRILRPGS